jgi:hypothetical protein
MDIEILSKFESSYDSNVLNQTLLIQIATRFNNSSFTNI